MTMKAVLFDLDGTLLPMDTEGFVKMYLKSLAPYVSHFIQPEKLVEIIWKATDIMIANKEKDRTNEEVFIEAFVQLSGIEKEVIWPTFDRFYEEEFPKLHIYTNPIPELSRKVVQAAVDRGYKVAIATNPVFPGAAIRERVRWAGLADFPFEWVTVYEETHFCKPNPEYFIEITERLGVRPEECVMVGNDHQEDLVASVAGLKTYYIDQHRIDRGQPAYTPDGEGSMQDLLRDLKEHKGIFA